MQSICSGYSRDNSCGAELLAAYMAHVHKTHINMGCPSSRTASHPDHRVTIVPTSIQWPNEKMAFELFGRIADHLSRDDLLRCRLVNCEFEPGQESSRSGGTSIAKMPKGMYPRRRRLLLFDYKTPTSTSLTTRRWSKALGTEVALHQYLITYNRPLPTISPRDHGFWTRARATSARHRLWENTSVTMWGLVAPNFTSRCLEAPGPISSWLGPTHLTYSAIHLRD